LPTELSALSALRTLAITGDHVSPAGAPPAALAQLANLTSLHLEATALSALADDLFTSLANVSTLVLVGNMHMAGVPTSIAGLALQSL
jgi:hypothetical protein